MFLYAQKAKKLAFDVLSSQAISNFEGGAK